MPGRPPASHYTDFMPQRSGPRSRPGRSSIDDPRRLDVAAVAAAGVALAGTWPLAGFARLDSVATDVPIATLEVTWRVAGSEIELAGAGRSASLLVDAHATVAAVCQRCLRPMGVRLDVERRIVFVPGEDRAEALDAESEDDVLALPDALDLHALVEDELLLAMPIVPCHEVCPEPLAFEAGGTTEGEDPADHPFAALATWKTGRPN